MFRGGGFAHRGTGITSGLVRGYANGGPVTNDEDIVKRKTNNMYKVKIKYFADKIYTNTDIQTILHEIAIFTDIENIISITKVTNVN